MNYVQVRYTSKTRLKTRKNVYLNFENSQNFKYVYNNFEARKSFECQSFLWW